MLTLELVAVLADQKRVSTLLLRFFLQLLLHYDLTQYRAVHPRQLVRSKIAGHRVAQHLRELTALGILERGPSVRGGSSKWMTPTYRLAPQYVLTARQRREQEALLEARLERERLIPPPASGP